MVAAFSGAGAMFLIQPPYDLWFLAWLAPIPWLWLITKKMVLHLSSFGECFGVPALFIGL